MNMSVQSRLRIIGIMMVVTVILNHMITPTIYLANSRIKARLNETIPNQFGNWKEEFLFSTKIINPDLLNTINAIYTDTISRNYINGKGERVMLSIAYGVKQRSGTSLHYPEVCYPAQGFDITAIGSDNLKTKLGTIRVKRLESNMLGQRYEPITYWTTIGNEVTPGGIDKRLKEFSYGLKGIIPDGVVFRVSTIDRDVKHAYTIQDMFVDELISVLQPEERQRLAGLH